MKLQFVLFGSKNVTPRRKCSNLKFLAFLESLDHTEQENNIEGKNILFYVSHPTSQAKSSLSQVQVKSMWSQSGKVKIKSNQIQIRPAEVKSCQSQVKLATLRSPQLSG